MVNTTNAESLLGTEDAAHRVAIVGASGYGGLQSIKLLKDHPYFKVSVLVGEKSAGSRWNSLCPFLELPDNPTIINFCADEIAKSSDFAILSLPNGLASKLVPDLLNKNIRVLDLSADYRYRSLDHWKHVYVSEAEQIVRDDNELCEEAIYGLSEWFPSQISNSRLVSCPGCFPTASLLPLLPFLKQGLVENDGIIIDAKTGTSGGGRIPKQTMLLAEASESINPYGVIGHRHTSEIEQLATEVAGQKIELQFTPHLVPMVRGILSTVYGRLRDPGLTAEDCRTVLETVYRHNPTISVLPVGIYPATKWVRNTNKAYLSVQVDSRTGRIILMSAIDNLVKGQAGQAIQNLNLMAGLPQETGLPLTSFYP